MVCVLGVLQEEENEQFPCSLSTSRLGSPSPPPAMSPHFSDLKTDDYSISSEKKGKKGFLNERMRNKMATGT